MAVRDDALVRAVGRVELREVLHDQERLDPVAGEVGELTLEEVEPPEGRELVE